MIFCNVSIVTVLILAMIELLEYYDVGSIKGYPTESFSQVERIENNGDLSVQN